jgi:two-component system sensor histidine kinase MtrB
MIRPGLRTRVMAGFAVGAMLISVAGAAGSYQLSERFLLAERERNAIRATNYDANIIRGGLTTQDPDYLGVLRTLDTGSRRRAVIRAHGQWYSRVADTGITDSVPLTVTSLVEAGQPALQRVRLSTGLALVIGIPLDENTAFYVVDSMQELDRSLQLLGLILTLMAVATTAGGAGLGWYASRYVVRPLTRFADAARDITAGDFTARLDPATEPDLARLTDSFNQMACQLSNRLERDRRFAADVSHELRSPLQTLEAAASVLRRRQSEMDPRSAAAAGLITQEIARFQVLVTDLLELARTDQPPDKVPVKIAELAQQLCRSKGFGPEIVIAEPGAVAVWQVDRRRFQQVLANLLDNAGKHGGGPVLVGIGQSAGVNFLYVDDEGPGVSPPDRDSIFSRFVRGRPASARGDSDGTGLGLALAAQHVRAHGGRIFVTDRPGGGARFRVELPQERS